MNALLEVTDVRKSFGKQTVLDGVSLKVHGGESLALVGENGAGKSTLLKLCVGLLTPDSGSIARTGRVGYCPQDPGLLDLLDAREHFALFGAGIGLSEGAALERGMELMEGLESDPERIIGKPSKVLSGGERQKLNLALALLSDPEILLLDEPYQGFDRGSYLNFWRYVDKWSGEGRAVIVVTHLLAELDSVDHVHSLQVGGVRR